MSYQLATSIAIVGLREAILTKNCALRCIWILLFLIGVGSTAIFLYVNVTTYLSDPTVTKVKIVANSTYKYPPIVFCHDAWFDFEKITAFGLNKDGLKYALGYSQYGRLLALSNFTEARAEFFTVYRKHNFSSLVDFFRAITVDIEPKYSFAEFANSRIPSYLALRESPKLRKVIIPFGPMCYAFTLRPAEARLGILFEPDCVAIKFEDRTGGLMRTDEDWSIFLSADVNAVYTRPLIIQASKNSFLQLKARRYEALDKAAAPCRPSVLNKSYTGGTCMADCANRLYKVNATCEILWMANDNNNQPPSKFCNFFELQLQIANPDAYFHEQAALIREHVKRICYAECPRRCERTVYDTTLVENVHSEELHKIEDIRKMDNMSLTLLCVIHEAMQLGGIITIKEMDSYTFTELVNDIGGTLGLFVGCTLMTFLQAGLFFVNYACEAWSHKKNYGISTPQL